MLERSNSKVLSLKRSSRYNPSNIPEISTMASLSPVPLTRANLLSIATSSSASPSASPALLDNDVNSTYVPTISTATLKRRNSRCSLKFEGWSSNDHCHHVSKVHKTLTRQCEYSGGEKEIRISCNEKRLAHRYVGISFNTMHKIVEMYVLWARVGGLECANVEKEMEARCRHGGKTISG